MSSPNEKTITADELDNLVEMLTIVYADLHPLCAREGVEVQLSASRIKEACACLSLALEFCRTLEARAPGRRDDGQSH